MLNQSAQLDMAILIITICNPHFGEAGLAYLLQAARVAPQIPRQGLRLVGGTLEVSILAQKEDNIMVLARHVFILFFTNRFWERTPRICGNGGFSLRKKEFVDAMLSR